MYEDYTGKDLILATGAPGSRWSGVLRMITANPEINITDETKDRTYDHYNLNPDPSTGTNLINGITSVSENPGHGGELKKTYYA